MLKEGFKWAAIIILLVSYLNRGLFVAMPETEQCLLSEMQQNEINSVLEFVINFIDEENNNHTDEDGNSPEQYGIFKLVQPFIFQTFAQLLEHLNKLPSVEKEIFTPVTENIPVSQVYGQIDHPPQA